jgi:hypothetical protein
MKEKRRREDPLQGQGEDPLKAGSRLMKVQREAC